MGKSEVPNQRAKAHTTVPDRSHRPCCIEAQFSAMLLAVEVISACVSLAPLITLQTMQKHSHVRRRSPHARHTSYKCWDHGLHDWPCRHLRDSRQPCRPTLPSSRSPQFRPHMAALIHRTIILITTPPIRYTEIPPRPQS